MTDDRTILISQESLPFRRRKAEADANAPCRDGTPMTRHEVAHVREGEFFQCDPERAAELLAKRRAFPAVLDAPLALIAEAVLPAPTA